MRDYLLFTVGIGSNPPHMFQDKGRPANGRSNRRKCLITGGTGFVGSALVRALVVHRDVRIVVRTPPASSSESVAEVVQIRDIGPQTDWREALSGIGTVIHLAGLAHVMGKSPADPFGEFRRVNSAGATKLARQAAEAHVGRFVFVSSIGVNGDATFSTPFSEADAPNPQGPYAISKWEAEQSLMAIAAQTGMETVIIRPPLVYGPNAPGNFGRIRRLVGSGLPLPFGAIRNRRSFVGLDNLVDFILICIEHAAAANETFLLSDDEDLSTADLIRRLARAMGRPARLVPVPESVLFAAAVLFGQRDIARRLLGTLQVDISKARRLLQWVPPISVDEGLRLAVATR